MASQACQHLFLRYERSAWNTAISTATALLSTTRTTSTTADHNRPQPTTTDHHRHRHRHRNRAHHRPPATYSRPPPPTTHNNRDQTSHITPPTQLPHPSTPPPPPPNDYTTTRPAPHRYHHTTTTTITTRPAHSHISSLCSWVPPTTEGIRMLFIGMHALVCTSSSCEVCGRRCLVDIARSGLAVASGPLAVSSRRVLNREGCLCLRATPHRSLCRAWRWRISCCDGSRFPGAGCEEGPFWGVGRVEACAAEAGHVA